MARPRTVSDERILAAVARAVRQHGPLRFTLADVAADVGLTPAALVRRFGTKRRLLLALVEQGPTDVRRRFRAARAAHASPLRALVAVLAEDPGTPSTRAEVASGLAFLQIDLTDPDFHRATLAYFRAFRREVHALIDRAMGEGELRPVDVDALTRAIEVTHNGSLLTWAVHAEGHAGEAIRQDLDVLLGPYRLTAGNAPSGASRPR